MSLIRTLDFIARHPLNRKRPLRAVTRFATWQIASRLAPGDILFEWINGARAIVRRGDSGFTGNIYCGLHEFEDMAYVLHVLDDSDLFVDVGANVGSYTLLACAARGARGYAFEPVPSTYRRLIDNLRINDLMDRVTALNAGASHQEGELTFTTGENCTNHVLGAGEQASAAVTVRTLPLDSVLKDESPSLIKIDVEGFETRVLEGARQTLDRQSLHTVLMEINGSGTRYGFSDERLLGMMKEHGFGTFAYDPWSRQLRSLDGAGSGAANTIFIRDPERVERRLKQSPKVNILDTDL